MHNSYFVKESYDLNDLLQIMEILRSPNGCPWDREQNHKSIRKNFIEETYEVLEAIDNNDTDLLREELGDVLLQIVFHSQMEKEAGNFDFNDVANDICKKIIERHPHVFSDTLVDSSTQVLKNWDEIKKQKKNQKTQSEVINSIPRNLPALMRSTKVQQKAAKIGFDWPDINGALDKLTEEIEELKAAINKKDKKSINDEFGDVLFSAVNISRFLLVDAEEALTESCDKFIKRFEKVENLSVDKNLKLNELSIGELDELWEEAKILISSGENTCEL